MTRKIQLDQHGNFPLQPTITGKATFSQHSIDAVIADATPEIIPPTRDIKVIRQRIRDSYRLDAEVYGFAVAVEALQIREKNYLMAGDDLMQTACGNVLWEIFTGKATEYADYSTEI